MRRASMLEDKRDRINTSGYSTKIETLGQLKAAKLEAVQRFSEVMESFQLKRLKILTECIEEEPDVEHRSMAEIIELKTRIRSKQRAVQLGNLVL